MPRQQKSITITLAPSKPLLFLYGLLAAFTSASLFYLPISAFLLGIASVLVCSLCAYVVFLHALLWLPKSLVALHLNAKGEWQAQNKKGEMFAVKIAPNSFVSHFLTVVNLQSNTGKHLGSMLIMPSRVDQDLYRRLRVQLLWGRTAHPQAADSLDALEKAN